MLLRHTGNCCFVWGRSLRLLPIRYHTKMPEGSRVSENIAVRMSVETWLILSWHRYIAGNTMVEVVNAKSLAWKARGLGFLKY